MQQIGGGRGWNSILSDATGTAGMNTYGGYGGFGGGGGGGYGTASNPQHSAGGAGGYSGGGITSINYYGGGGGGSYNIGANQTNEDGSITTRIQLNGQILITYISSYAYNHIFTNCGASGINGPTLIQCTTEYITPWDNDITKFNVWSYISPKSEKYWSTCRNKIQNTKKKSSRSCSDKSDFLYTKFNLDEYFVR